VSRKSERLVNLTIALLATKRYLTKSEIFNSVAGYSGDAEARDRMFERDKDDLRKLGITIELGTFDPLFEDEAGYRIKPETYALQLKDLTSTQLNLLAQASSAWKEASLADAAHSGLRKLKSLGINSDLASLPDFSITLPAPPEQIGDVIEAVTQRRKITFEYLDEDLSAQVRSVEPYKLSHAKGHWYLIGRDTEKNALRTFRVDRFASSVNITGSVAAYEIDTEALQAEESRSQVAPKKALIALRKGRGHSLRSSHSITSIDEEWDKVEVAYFEEDRLIAEVLWLKDDAKILEPRELVDSLIEKLQKVVKLHG
jgi:proteasome accessory factor B